MRRTILILASITTLAMVTAAYADDWSKEYKVTGTPELRVETNDADIRINSADTSSIQVHVTTEGLQIAPDKVRITERQSGNRVEVEVHRPSEIHIFTIHARSRYIRIDVTVPRQANLNLHTSDGNVSIDSVKGQMRVDTGDGHIEGDRLDGGFDAHSGDGHIRVRGRFDALQLRSGDGRIEAEALAGSKMSAGWSVRSGDGSVRLSVPESFAADLDAHTGDGHITLNFPVTMSGSFDRSTVRGKINGGGQFLEIRTGDGNITLDKL
jgi:DUF4097 and DUF4098 domain-containing protein YvlB